MAFVRGGWIVSGLKIYNNKLPNIYKDRKVLKYYPQYNIIKWQVKNISPGNCLRECEKKKETVHIEQICFKNKTNIDIGKR